MTLPGDMIKKKRFYYQDNSEETIGIDEINMEGKRIWIAEVEFDAIEKMNNFKYSNTNKRYYTLDYYFKQRFNTKVGRIPINGGFTCPNIDGTTGFGGCTFCSIKGSGDYAGLRTDDLLEQWDAGKEMMMKKWNIS